MTLISSDQPPSPSEILQSLKAFPINLLKIYPRSFCSKNGLWYGLIRTSEDRKFVVMGDEWMS